MTITELIDLQYDPTANGRFVSESDIDEEPCFCSNPSIEVNRDSGRPFYVCNECGTARPAWGVVV